MSRTIWFCWFFSLSLAFLSSFAMSADLELVYWPGFSGRAEPIQFLLEAAKVKYTMNNQVVAFIGDVKEKEALFACPIIRQGDFILSQTTAIMVHLAEKYGFDVPEEKKAHGLMAALNLGDVWTEGYNGRKEEDKGAAFLKNRLAKWLAVADGVVKKYGGKFFFGDKLSYVDFLALNVHNALLYMYGDEYMVVANKFGKLREVLKNVKAVPEIAAFVAGDRFLPVLYDKVSHTNRKK